MYYIEENNKIIFFDEDLEILLATVKPHFTQEDVKETDKEIVRYKGNLYFSDDEEYLALKQQDEQAHIMSLSMTRSDFFDGMIKAFGIGQEELKQAIILVLSNIQITDIEKKIALNNYDNALNFYRKHPLFTMLSNIPIPIAENIIITITAEQWNNFFIKTSEKDEDAYKELLRKDI